MGKRSRDLDKEDGAAGTSKNMPKPVEKKKNKQNEPAKEVATRGDRVPVAAKRSKGKPIEAATAKQGQRASVPARRGPKPKMVSLWLSL